MTPAEFIDMLDAATPEEMEQIARRLVGPIMNVPIADLPILVESYSPDDPRITWTDPSGRFMGPQGVVE